VRGDRRAEPRFRSVLVVQEYVPEYRRSFFERLESALDSGGARLRVAVGAPSDELSARHDAAPALPIVVTVPTRTVSIRRRSVALRRLSALTADADLVIVDQAIRHLETYPLLARQRWGPLAALWGHGRRRVKEATSLERFLERRLTHAAHWFFAYTAGGADDVAATGFPRSRVTVVQNAIDTRELAALRAAVSTAESARLRHELALPATNVCLFVGALDASKRIGFLLDACAAVAARLPEFALVVAGDGSDRELVERRLRTAPWLRYVGRATGEQEARLGAISDLLLMPGRVGLVAVDSFALGTPIVTTRWPYHAPEFEYLEDGVNARISDDDVAAFAHALEELLSSPDELARLTRGCETALPRYTLETMVDNFADGVFSALRAPRR
jgi:glycosyltransferase involved in cell wall biosynthesis